MGSGFFPLDERWQLNETAYSNRLAQQMVWLNAQLPYDQCQAIFARIGKVHLPSSSQWRQTQRHGERLKAYVDHQQAQVAVERVVIPERCHDHVQQKGVSLDGGMVHIRDEGWKEMKVGTVFDVEQRLEKDPATEELVEVAHAHDTHYVAVVGSTEQFAPALWACAVTQDVPTARDCSVTADGAAWIWNLADDYFPDSRQIVDWYHATQHLAQAALALYPEDEKQRQRWYSSVKMTCFRAASTKLHNHLNRRVCLNSRFTSRPINGECNTKISVRKVIPLALEPLKVA